MPGAGTMSDVVNVASSAERLGIVGVLVLVAVLLGYAAWYFRRECAAAHVAREAAIKEAQGVIDGLRDDLAQLKQMFLIVKIAGDAKGAVYDLSEVGDLDDLLTRKR